MDTSTVVDAVRFGKQRPTQVRVALNDWELKNVPFGSSVVLVIGNATFRGTIAGRGVVCGESCSLELVVDFQDEGTTDSFIQTLCIVGNAQIRLVQRAPTMGGRPNKKERQAKAQAEAERKHKEDLIKHGCGGHGACPNCGFSYAYNGKQCLHCSSAPRKHIRTTESWLLRWCFMLPAWLFIVLLVWVVGFIVHGWVFLGYYVVLFVAFVIWRYSGRRPERHWAGAVCNLVWGGLFAVRLFGGVDFSPEAETNSMMIGLLGAITIIGSWILWNDKDDWDLFLGKDQ